MDTSVVKEFVVTYLMPEKCFQNLLVDFHFHVPCLKFVLNKACGLWILLDILLAQLPQLLKILWKGRAEGLSLTSALLQLYTLSCPVVFAMANNFPLFAWAERLFSLVQTAAIVFLILRYRGETKNGFLFLLAYGAVMFLLGSFVAAALISVMQTSSLAALILSKVFQAGANYSNGHTGQLSTLSVIISFAGSVSVSFVSLQGTGNALPVICHVLSSCLSFVLLVQIFFCRSSTGNVKHKNE
ncbi:mannose-P-dolichol utilization defect 1 protein-like [Sphaeramia orbicularis]|uniref:mannose-P-dolichol utilization defect 1 protein-like n=1 Tax=Sphaeramia orbicularis TaxID=375764 RepID=UPI00117C567A|nr:mannose-P-dolichol utilization defect 1 protein-like [Sphaeramia orbicularis]